jgi:hypothetical protein
MEEFGTLMSCVERLQMHSDSPHERSFYSHCCNELQLPQSSGVVTANSQALLHKMAATDTQRAIKLSRMSSYEAP